MGDSKIGLRRSKAVSLRIRTRPLQVANLYCCTLLVGTR